MTKSRDLNSVPQMLREDLTPLERGVEEENVNRVLTKQEMEDAEDNAANLDDVTYTEAPAPKFENATAWEGVALVNLWTP